MSSRIWESPSDARSSQHAPPAATLPSIANLTSSLPPQTNATVSSPTYSSGNRDSDLYPSQPQSTRTSFQWELHCFVSKSYVQHLPTLLYSSLSKDANQLVQAHRPIRQGLQTAITALLTVLRIPANSRLLLTRVSIIKASPPSINIKTLRSIETAKSIPSKAPDAAVSAAKSVNSEIFRSTAALHLILVRRTSRPRPSKRTSNESEASRQRQARSALHVPPEMGLCTSSPCRLRTFRRRCSQERVDMPSICVQLQASLQTPSERFIMPTGLLPANPMHFQIRT